jgi:TPR repeat protein
MTPRSLLTALALAASLWPAPGCAQASARDAAADLRAAEADLAAGRYGPARAGFLRHADDDGLAQFTLGLFDQLGWRRPVDAAAACGWFAKAAARGVPAGQHLLGDCYRDGVLPADDRQATAVEWYLKAADNGHIVSLCSAGELYMRGEGVPQDAPRGLALCARAAQAESTPAMMMLARDYQDGALLPRDLAAARNWYGQAAQRHVHAAQYRLGVMLARGEGGPPDPAAALFWLETAAGDGYAPAYLPTAELYAQAAPDAKTGALPAEDLAKAYLWTEAAKARERDPALLDQARTLETRVLAVLPAPWKPPLDRQVAEHLAQHPATD